MQVVIILRGLPASGKTTLAKELIEGAEGLLKRVNKDSIRAMLDFGIYTKENEVLVKLVHQAIIGMLLERGFSVIIDDTNMRASDVTTVIDLIDKHVPATKQPVKLEILTMREPPEVCIGRDAVRENSVGKEAILRLHSLYEEFDLSDYFKYIGQRKVAVEISDVSDK